MLKILTRKAFFCLVSLFIVLAFTFVLMKAIPGDPFQQEQSLPPEIYHALKQHYGFNDPLYEQFFSYITQLFTFDFGPSLVYKGRTVQEIILTGFPVSAALGLEALCIAVPAGLIIGLYAALRKGKWQDQLFIFFAVLCISIPSFIIATLLQYVIGMKLHLLPIGRWGTFPQSIMPAISLALLPMAFIARMTRAKFLVELKQPYVTTARAMGISESRIIIFHVLRNILSPVLAYLGPLAASVMTGSFVIEKIFAIPGIGYWFVASVLNRDYPLIIGITIFYSALLLIASFAVDMLCLWLDPRLVAASEEE